MASFSHTPSFSSLSAASSGLLFALNSSTTSEKFVKVRRSPLRRSAAKVNKTFKIHLVPSLKLVNKTFINKLSSILEDKVFIYKWSVEAKADQKRFESRQNVLSYTFKEHPAFRDFKTDVDNFPQTNYSKLNNNFISGGLAKALADGEEYHRQNNFSIRTPRPILKVTNFQPRYGERGKKSIKMSLIRL